MNIEVLIHHAGKIYTPAVKEGLTIETVRKGSAGKLKLSVVKDEFLDFEEGDAISVKVDGQNLFHGYVFTKKRSDLTLIDVTAYDQLRYLKNKDTAVFENMTASAILKKIASDFKLKTGEIEDTGFVIASQVESNEELFQMIQNAITTTNQNTGKMYVLFDDFGKLTLKSFESMQVGLQLDESVISGFDYQTSIDHETYNQVKLLYEDEGKGSQVGFVDGDLKNVAKWGVLQKVESVKKHENMQERAKLLLAKHNRKTRKLSVKGALGDVRVRAGVFVAVGLKLGDINASQKFLVEKCVHTLKENEHLMDLTLVGGEFVG